MDPFITLHFLNCLYFSGCGIYIQVTYLILDEFIKTSYHHQLCVCWDKPCLPLLIFPWFYEFMKWCVLAWVKIESSSRLILIQDLFINTDPPGLSGLISTCSRYNSGASENILGGPGGETSPSPWCLTSLPITSPLPKLLPGKTNGRLHICGPFRVFNEQESEVERGRSMNGQAGGL